jgi:hypothetical protein
VNQGHPAIADVGGTVGNAVLQLASGAANALPPGLDILAQLGTLLAGLGLNLILGNRDGVLFAGNRPISGAELYAQTASGKWVIQYDYGGLPHGGHYNVTFGIQRTAG